MEMVFYVGSILLLTAEPKINIVAFILRTPGITYFPPIITRIGMENLLMTLFIPRTESMIAMFATHSV